MSELKQANMKASDKFVKGQRVRMTSAAISMGLQGNDNRRVGVVQGFPTKNVLTKTDASELVWVLRDGDSRHETYHMTLWEPI